MWSTIILRFMLLNRKGYSHFLWCTYITDFSCPNAILLPTNHTFFPSDWTSIIIRLLRIWTCLPVGLPHLSVLHECNKQTAWLRYNSTKRECSTLSQYVTLTLERLQFLCKMQENGQLCFPIQLTLCKKFHTGLVFNQLCYSADFCIVGPDEANAEGSFHRYCRS